MEDADKDVEKTNSGIQKKGDIEDIAGFAREVEECLEDSVEEESIDEFNEWRPREEDDEKDIEKKTVKAASVSKKEVEEESNGVKKDLAEAGKKTVEAVRKVVEERTTPDQEIKEASKNATKPVFSGSVRMTRKLEETIYSNMTRFNPYFFDAKEFSADLRSERDGGYKMDVNIPDSDRRNTLEERFKGNR